jgi:hypothetical protein
MDEPKVGQDYYFVRRAGGAFHPALFRRTRDGRAWLWRCDFGLYGPACYAWRDVLSDLRQAGYAELAAAVGSGAIDKEEADCLVTVLSLTFAPPGLADPHGGPCPGLWYQLSPSDILNALRLRGRA